MTHEKIQIVDKMDILELRDGLQFLLLNSKSSMYFLKQKILWEKMRRLAVFLGNSLNKPVTDVLKNSNF